MLAHCRYQIEWPRAVLYMAKRRCRCLGLRTFLAAQKRHTNTIENGWNSFGSRRKLSKKSCLGNEKKEKSSCLHIFFQTCTKMSFPLFRQTLSRQLEKQTISPSEIKLPEYAKLNAISCFCKHKHFLLSFFPNPFLLLPFLHWTPSPQWLEDRIDLEPAQKREKREKKSYLTHTHPR